MKIKIGTAEYTRIENLKFDPQADITGTSVAINEFSCDIKTGDTINFGDFAYLYDDAGTLWAKYWITEVEHQNKEFVTITAQSMLLLLDRITLPAVMYSGTAVSDVLAGIFASASNAAYELDPSLSVETITGFCPKQTAKERLQWVCFSMCAYIRSFFSEDIKILPVATDADDETDKLGTVIPLEKVFYRPSLTYNDFVTEVKATSYSYTQGTPQSTDTYVTTGEEGSEVYYIQTSQETSLKQTKESDGGTLPDTAAENVIDVTNVTIVNSSNISKILTNLARHYFKRVEVDFDAVDDGSYLPGQKVTVPLDKSTDSTGYIETASFSFGHAQKAQIKMRQYSSVDTVGLTIVYTGLNSVTIRTDNYFLPEGAGIDITNPYIDYLDASAKYVYIPDNEKATGTMAGEAMTITEPCSVALKYDTAAKTLTVNSVDEMEFKARETSTDTTTAATEKYQGGELTIK